jgi:hypothetical protein
VLHDLMMRVMRLWTAGIANVLMIKGTFSSLIRNPKNFKITVVIFY